MVREITERVRPILLAMLVLWGAWACGVEIVSAWRAPSPSPPSPPPFWTLRSPEAVELRDLLLTVDRELPAGSFLATGTHGLSPSEDFFVSLWVSYYLPHHDVARAFHRWPLERADYLFLYRSSVEDFGERAVAAAFPERPLLLREHPAGSLYRIPRP
jgi:hypothetical protein